MSVIAVCFLIFAKMFVICCLFLNFAYFHGFQPLRQSPLIAANVLAAWRRRGLAKARTRANDDVTCSVSAETTPRLRQTARWVQCFLRSFVLT